jgi:hypothetical protein
MRHLHGTPFTIIDAMARAESRAETRSTARVVVGQAARQQESRRVRMALRPSVFLAAHKGAARDRQAPARAETVHDFLESLDICRNPWRIFEIIGKWPEQRIQAFKRLFQELLSEGIREDE